MVGKPVICQCPKCLKATPVEIGYCHCGCGELVNKYRKRINRYLPNHHLRKRVGPPPGVDAKYDPEDEALVMSRSWYVNSNGYLAGQEKGHKHVYLHRVIMSAPKDMQVDHINGDKLDNRRSNLRIVNGAHNSQNIGMLNPRSESGIRGVNRAGKRWRARAKMGGQEKHIGHFDTPNEAAKAIHEWRLKNMPGYIARA